MNKKEEYDGIPEIPNEKLRKYESEIHDRINNDLPITTAIDSIKFHKIRESSQYNGKILVYTVYFSFKDTTSISCLIDSLEVESYELNNAPYKKSSKFGLKCSVKLNEVT